jgi:tubulin--tyrosine ligase
VRIYPVREVREVLIMADRPNYGRNSTALFALSSGTIGGAMEAAVCGKRAIALSYAFHNRNHDPIIIKGASKVSVRIVEHLHQNWAEGVDLFSVNVPLIEGIDGPDAKILYTNMLQNYWSSGSSFEPVDAEDDLGPEESEAQIREQGEQGDEGERKGVRHLKFKWAPKFSDVYGSVETVGSLFCWHEQLLIWIVGAWKRWMGGMEGTCQVSHHPSIH